MVRAGGKLDVIRDPEAPTCRSQCRDGPRPCPWVACRFHLLLDVTEDGRLKQNHGFDEHDAQSIADALQLMPQTCSLDVADRGPHRQQEIGDALGLTKQSIELMELRAIQRVQQLVGTHPDDPYLRLMEMTPDERRRYGEALRASMRRPQRNAR